MERFRFFLIINVPSEYPAPSFDSSLVSLSPAATWTTIAHNEQTTLVEGNTVTPVAQTLHFKTQTKVPRVGVMLVGLGGNNGTTVAAGILANKHGLKWNTKVGCLLLMLLSLSRQRPAWLRVCFSFRHAFLFVRLLLRLYLLIVITYC